MYYLRNTVTNVFENAGGLLPENVISLLASKPTTHAAAAASTTTAAAAQTVEQV